MKVQIAIVCSILVVGGFLFMPGAIDVIPGGQNLVDYIENNVGEVPKQTVEKIGGTVDSSINTVNNKITDIKDSSEEFLSKQNIPNIIPTKLEDEELEEIEFHGKLEDKPEFPPAVSRHANGAGSPSASTTNAPTVVTTPQTQTISYETLSLITEKQADDTVKLKYKDTSGKTLSVTVTMRNEQKILFTGQFFSSSFEATVLDAANTPHFIDMIVDHADHGKISASAFNPAGNTDSSINGVFSSG
ncbi:MAG: hypothetical protein DWQ18_00325 [Crenarchaeota archaeon]|nr:MAG: hypothetical protein DWQ17_04890 [Thermoproteota archaeon]RDJ34431.1 MAG: hypothetical protein DWQ18_00325 [Thermoproteota archaeon]RDJ34769.1 MAG: hypothetical protein DWQ19_13440 [Thermoproteota archaeon]RDJ38630.1 MAG: hypothetical protein DWQ13_04495 [Thermoproteota archaeon]